VDEAVFTAPGPAGDVVTWPDSTTSRKALRVVQQGDTWLVDQSEDIAELDEAHGNPVRDALTRGVTRAGTEDLLVGAA
jgi:hypothetical protein